MRSEPNKCDWDPDKKQREMSGQTRKDEKKPQREELNAQREKDRLRRTPQE